MALEAATTQVDAVTAMVKFTGALTLGTSLKTADSRIQTLIERGISRLVLDLAGVPYIDSAGLGLLVYAYGLIQERNGKLRLCGVTERVAALLRLTRTDAYLPIDADAETSLAALG